ncbi:hypothetical protein D3C85_1395500 [compost metagenome]
MIDEILDNILLLGKLHKHECSKTIKTAELYSPINRIIIKIIDEKEIQVKYNVCDETKIVELPILTTYDFVEKLIIRTARIQITPKIGKLIEINKGQLKQDLIELQREKNYNHYLKHVKFDSDIRFEVEYFDDMVIIRDKQNIFLTTILKLRNAIKGYDSF